MRGFGEAAASVRDLLDASQLDPGIRNRVELIFEEMATNIIRHAAASSDIDARIDIGEREVVLTFDDDGVPFDPSAQTALGFGLTLVRKMASHIDYERTAEHRNRVRVGVARP